MLASTSALNVEHHPRAALRVGRGPRRLGGERGVDRAVEFGGAAEPDARLDHAVRRVPHIAMARRRGDAGAVDEMVDAAHGICPGSKLEAVGRRPSQARTANASVRDKEIFMRRLAALFRFVPLLIAAAPPSTAARLNADRRAGQRGADEANVSQAGQLRHAPHLVVADRPQARHRRVAELGARPSSSATRRLAATASSPRGRATPSPAAACRRRPRSPTSSPSSAAPSGPTTSSSSPAISTAASPT